MQIRVNLKIFIFIIIFYLTRQIEIYGILMLFAFLHELGHLFAGLFLGFRPQSLTVNPLGLAINFEIKADDYNEKIAKGNMLALKKLIIAASGPAVNFMLSMLFVIFNIEMLGITQEILVYSNLLIGLFNLIPIYPLDGGRILKNILHITTGLKNTYSYINFISNTSIVILTIFSSIMILYLENISIVFIIGYLWYLVMTENKFYMQRRRIYEIIDNNANHTEPTHENAQ